MRFLTCSNDRDSNGSILSVHFEDFDPNRLEADITRESAALPSPDARAVDEVEVQRLQAQHSRARQDLQAAEAEHRDAMRALADAMRDSIPPGEAERKADAMQVKVASLRRREQILSDLLPQVRLTLQTRREAAETEARAALREQLQDRLATLGDSIASAVAPRLPEAMALRRAIRDLTTGE